VGVSTSTSVRAAIRLELLLRVNNWTLRTSDEPEAYSSCYSVWCVDSGVAIIGCLPTCCMNPPRSTQFVAPMNLAAIVDKHYNFPRSAWV